MRKNYWFAALSFGTAVSASTAAAAQQVGAEEAVLRSEMQGALQRLSELGALPRNGEAMTPISLSIPASRVASLGVLLDGLNAEGPLVIGTTPGGIAQSAGVRTGDVLLMVNGLPLEHGPAAVAQIRDVLDKLPDQSPLSLHVLRQGRPLDLSGTLTARYLPPMRMEIGEANLVASNGAAALGSTAAAAGPSAAVSGCGRISVFHIAPRSKDLYPSHILAIDGHIPGATTQETYRVAAGTHTLTVAEDIDSVELPTLYSRVRADHHKILSIDVRPNVTYLVASRLNTDRRTRVASGEYWDPVVWKEISESCGN